MSTPRTLFEKIWEQHVVTRREGEALLYVDRNFVHEGAFHAFAQLAKEGRKVRKPRQTFATADHYVPTVGRERGIAGIADAEMREMLQLYERNARDHGIDYLAMDDPRQGIVHVIGPELGLTQPGLTITCGDSHTSTHGAFGALAVGIGASQLKQVLATQCLWQKKPKTFRVVVHGTLGPGVSAKDVILSIIAKIGIGGATGHTIEYAGSAIRALGMEGRLTICNMSIEAGARAGLVAPDDTTYEYLHGRDFAPRGEDWERALAWWRTLPSDPDAQFDREVTLDASTLEPTLTWGTLPEEALPVTARIPAPDTLSTTEQRAHAQQALRYMDLAPGTPLTDIRIDRAFIGTCTNARIDDLRAAAAILRGRKAVVPAWVSPGSTQVKRQAEAEGLDRIFMEAGFEWRASGCSACAAMNGDVIPAGMRCASTSNRNFEGRQGAGGRTHLVSPEVAAATAIAGRFAEARELAGTVR